MEREPGAATEIRISFENEKDAAAAYPYVEGVVICYYLYDDGIFRNEDEAVRGDPFQLFVMNYNEIIRDHDRGRLMRAHPDCALRYLRREDAEIVLERCADLQGRVPDLEARDRRGFFSCLCLLLALLFPMTPFRALCRRTAAGAVLVQETRAEYDAVAVHFTQSRGSAGEAATADWIIAPERLPERKDPKVVSLEEYRRMKQRGN